MIVIDASVANKLLLPLEEGHKTAKSLLKLHLMKEESIVVPDLLFIEVANTLATKSTIPPKKISASLTYLYNSGLDIHKFKSKEVIKAAELAKKYKTSVYDMLYVVLAEIRHCNLITADAKFVRLANLPHVRLLEEKL